MWSARVIFQTLRVSAEGVVYILAAVEIALAIAWGLLVIGDRIIAQVFLLMRLCGLRPGEAIRLCAEDFTPGWNNHVAPGVATIGLGMRGVLTKAKREQYVVVPPEDWRTHSIIRVLLASAVRGVALTRLRTLEIDCKFLS